VGLELADCARLDFDGMLTRICSFSGTDTSEGETKRGIGMMDGGGHSLLILHLSFPR